MNTVLTLACVALAAVLWRRVRARRREPSATVRRRSAMLATIAILGIQAVVLAPPASAQDCEAPNPERPGAGMVGAIDPARGQGEAGSAYIDHGYAGMVWNVYDTDCGSNAMGISNPDTTVDTWAGNQLFNIGKNIVGATNSLHYTVLEGGLLNPIYNAVSRGAEAVYSNIYAQLFGIAALVLAIFLFRNIWRGDLSTVSKRALFAIAGMWLAASSLALLRYYDEIDRAIVQTTTNIQAGFVDETENRVVRHVLPTDLHNKVVYENWLRGEFGSPDAPQAKQFGRRLLDAQAFTWEEIRNGDDGNAGVIERKQQSYREIANQLGPASGYFTGEDGSRTGAGFLSMLQSLVYALFQLFAKAAVLLAQILVRLFTLTAPLIGLVAILHHDILRRVGKVVGVVAFNLIILSVLAGVHALLLQAIFSAGNALSMLTQMVMAGLVTVLLFLVGKPGRRLWQMVETSVSMVGSAVPSPRGGLFSRLRKRSHEPTPQDEFWQHVREDDEAAGGAGTRGSTGAARGGRDRPEAAIMASAQRLDGTPRVTHPSTNWPGDQTAVGGGGGRAALPPAGSAAAGAFGEYVPSRAPGDYAAGAATARTAMTAAPTPSRRVDTVPVSDRGLDAGDADPFVVPSRMGSVGTSFPTSQSPGPPSPGPASPPNAAPPSQPGPASAGAGTQAPPAPQPRRAEREVVAGRSVFVVYRPSRGLEVRPDGTRDTDNVVR